MTDQSIIDSPILSSGILVSCDSLPHMTGYIPMRRFFNPAILQSGFYNLAISKLVVCNPILGFSKFQFCNPAIMFSYYEKDKLLIFS